jgi:hypothetical protein
LRRELLVGKPDDNLKPFFYSNGIANLITILLDNESHFPVNNYYDFSFG